MLPQALLFLALAVSSFFAAPVAAQWSDDPHQNLTLADDPAGQAQPKLVPTSDGGFYAAWLGGLGDGFDVYLQRLDADGNALWAEGGIRIANRDFSSTEDYGLAVDGAGNALLAFRFPDAGGTVQAVANVISPEGELRWAAPGVFASDDASAAAAPRIAPVAGGSAVVAWTSFASGATVLQKLDAEGALLWDDGVSLTTPSGAFFLADLHADPAGRPIVSGSAQLSNFDRRLWAQKLDADDGAPLWGTSPVEVFDGSDGALQFGYFPSFEPDGAGGAVFAWYQVGAPGEARVRVQHVLADGSLAFAQNGVDAATGTGRERSAPSVAYDALAGDIYVVWPEAQQSGGALTFGVSAQRVDADGTRQWGDAGRTLIPLGEPQASQVSAVATLGGAVFAWTLGSIPNPMRIEAARLDAQSAFVWPGEIVPIKTSSVSHSRMRGALGAWGYAAYVWTEGENGAALKAQNISPGGTLGIVAPPDAEVEPESAFISLEQDATATETLTLSNLAPGGEGTLTFTAAAVAPTTAAEDFEDGTNDYGLTLGIPQAETIETSGGNPDRWLRNDVVETAAPRLYVEAAPFTGDYVAQNVRSIRVDAQTVDAPFGVEERPLSLVLIRHNGEPDNVEAHDYVYYTGELAPQVGEGWQSYAYTVPSDFDGVLPEGWTGGYYGDLEHLPPGVVWQDILRSVDEVQVMWGHPAFFYLLQQFDIGVDNVAVDYEAASDILTVSPAAGAVAAGGSQNLTLTVDAAGLEEGSEYDLEVRLETSDPERPVVVVEVEVFVLMEGLDVEDGGEPEAVALEQPYPNPFSQTSTVGFSVPEATPVTLDVLDITGRRVARLAEAAFAAGRYTVTWDAGALPSGVYLLRLQTRDTVQTRRAVVQR